MRTGSSLSYKTGKSVNTGESVSNLSVSSRGFPEMSNDDPGPVFGLATSYRLLCHFVFLTKRLEEHLKPVMFRRFLIPHGVRPSSLCQWVSYSQ